MLGKNVTHLSLIAFFLSLNSYAQTSSDPILVTADRIKSTLDKSSSDIKVFETSEIEKATSITDLLSKESDLNLVQSGPSGANTSLFLRGSDSSHTLVFIDGIIMNDPSNPNRQFDLGRLGLNNVERVEILKGSQGLLYGSNAIGGVILITTKSAQDKLSGSALIDYGSFHTFNSGVNFQKKLNQTSLSFGIDHFNTKGFSSANSKVNYPADDDGEKRTTISTVVSQNLGSAGIFSLNYRGIFDKVDLDKGGGSGFDDPNDSQSNEQHYMKAGYHYDWKSAETQVNFTKSTQHRTLNIMRDALHTAESSTTNKGVIDALSVNHTQYTTSQLTQNINVDYQHEKDQLEHFNENLSLFFYNRYEIDANIINAGARIDSNKYFGEHLTYKVAFLHNFDPASMKMSYSTGFRAPSLNQLYDTTYGNKNLEPEKSQTAELGMEVPFAIHKYNSTVFYTDLNNRLSYDPVSFVNQNRGKARIVGWENIFDTEVSTDLNVKLAATWMQAKDMTANQKLARRPNFNAKLSINYQREEHSVGLESDYVGSRNDVDNLGNTVTMPSHLLFNLNYTLDISKKVATYFKVKNIFNKDYEEVFGYGTGGRAATVGIKYFF